MMFASSSGQRTGRWWAYLTVMAALLAPGLLKAVDDPTYSGIDRNPLSRSVRCGRLHNRCDGYCWRRVGER